MDIYTDRYGRVQKGCLYTGDLKDPVKDLKLNVVSLKVHIRRPNGLSWRTEESVLKRWGLCWTHQDNIKHESEDWISSEEIKTDFPFCFPFINQVTSLLVSTTHTQGDSSVFCKSLQPYPELLWSNLVGFLLFKLTQSVNYLIYPLSM